jgi:RHS repeat-associated protein
MMMMSAPGGVVPVQGIPGQPLLPPGWVPQGPHLPAQFKEWQWWWPVVDPEGDVFLPLRDSWALGGSNIWSSFLLGEFRYVPRVYLTRGETARSLIAEPNENVSHFERSLQKSLNMGRTEECNLVTNCQYPPHVNFNSFFADVNGDGLPDLISAAPPKRWTNGNGDSPLVCPMGHRVQLNRGYAFEDPQPSTAQNETLPSQSWALPDDPSHPLTKVANRDRSCDNSRPRIYDSDLAINPIQPGAVRPSYPTAAMAQTDINADGRVDIVLAYRPDGAELVTWQEVFLNTGRGYVRATPPRFDIPLGVALAHNIPYPAEVSASLTGWPRVGLGDMARFVDLDNDGLVDIVTGGLCYLGTVTNIHLGPPEICNPASWYRNTGTLPDRMVRIDSADGAWTTVDYESPKSNIVDLSADGIRPPATSRFVKTIRSASGPVPAPAGYDPFPVQETRLSYDNFVRDPISNEVLGFEKVTAEFVNAFNGVSSEPVKVTRTFDVRPQVLDASGTVLPVRYPLKGALISSVTETDGWVATELVEYALEPLGTGVRVRPWRELHGDVSPSATAAWTAEQTVSFDAYGNPTESVTGNWDGAAINPAEQRRTVGTLYENRTSGAGKEWMIGLVTRQQRLGYSEDIDGNADPAHVLGETLTTYDAKGNVATITRANIRAPLCDGADNDQTTYSYRASGVLKRSMEAAGPGDNYFRVVDFAYDAKELYVASASTSVGAMSGGVFVPASTALTASFVTDLRHGKTTQSTDPNGKSTTSTYDTAGRLVTRRGPDNTLLETNVYSDVFPVGTASTITTDIGKAFQRYTQLDADGHVLSITEGASASWSRKAKTRYDAFGRAVESFLPAVVGGMYAGITPSTGPKDVTTYDGFDRSTQVTHADGSTTWSYYEPRETTETDERWVVTLRGYDAFGELTTVTRGAWQPEASTHTFVRDGRGEIIKVTDGDGSVRRIERDGGGRIRFVTLPMQPGATPPRFAMCHDLDDKLVRLESPAGRVVTVVHDELGRTLQTTAIDANGLTVETSQTYDQGVAGGLGLGRLTSKTDESGTYALAYDAYGRPKTLSFAPSARAVAGASNVAASYGASFVYTPTGALTSVSFTGLPAAASLSYLRDERGRIRQIDTKEGAATTTLAADFLFEPDDKIKSARYGNGTSAQWSFNPLSERLDRIAYKDSAGADLAAVSYFYDPAGNPTREDREKNGALYTQKLHSFDALNRLLTTNASIPPSGNTDETFAFSPAGNLLTAGNEAYSYASPVSAQAVTAVDDPVAGKQRSLAYDPDGYLASDNETRADGSTSNRTLAFDPTGCMRSITREDLSAGGSSSSASSEYTCGLDGRVVARDTLKADGAHARRIDFAGLAEIRPDEGVFMLRVPVSGSVSVEDARSLSTGARVTALSGYLVNDARGSVLATTPFNPGATDVTTEVEYDAWGKKLADYSTLASPRHAFGGAEPDEAVGTYSFGARTYDPTLRRWVSPDPLLATVPGLDEALGDNLNLYAYAGNNPVRRIDLTGFEGENFSDRLKRITEFAKGLAQGGAEATVPGGMIAAAASPNPRGENAAAFAQGRAAGQIIGGVVSIFSGGQTIVGSAGLEVGSGGTATAVVVVTGALATAQVANGTAAIASGIKGSQTSAATGEPPEKTTGDARQPEVRGAGGEKSARGKDGAGKNGQHANQDRRAAAKDRYDGAKKEYEKLNSVRNKTPADKAARDSAKKTMEKARKDKDFTGENHSQRGKR